MFHSFARLATIRLAVMAVAGLALAGPAFAHAHLESTTPADKAVIATSPKQLELTFSEQLNLAFSGITLIGPAKAVVSTADAVLTTDDKTLVVPLPSALTAGRYTVEWHVLSTDGHKTKGSYSFSVMP